MPALNPRFSATTGKGLSQGLAGRNIDTLLPGLATIRPALRRIGFKLRRFFAKPLALELENQPMVFRTTSDFEFAIGGKINLPPENLRQLMELPATDLETRISQIDDQEQLISAVIMDSLRGLNNISRLLQMTELTEFSEENGWRELLELVLPLDARFDDFKEVALGKYLQYLSTCRDTLKSIAAVHAHRNISVYRHERTADELTVMEAIGKETPQRDSPRMRRLSVNEPVIVQVMPGKSMKLRLGHHEFNLVSGRGFYLFDTLGNDYELRPGRNVVGRHTENEVTVEPCFKSVSRRHLVIELLAFNSLQLIDLSSRGTWVQREQLKHLEPSYLKQPAVT